MFFAVLYATLMVRVALLTVGIFWGTYFTKEAFLEMLQECAVYETANPALVSVSTSTAAALLKPGLRAPLEKNVPVHGGASFSSLMQRSAGPS